MKPTSKDQWMDWSWYCLSCMNRIGDRYPFEMPGFDQSWMSYFRALYLTPEGAKIGGTNKSELIWEDEVNYNFPHGGHETLGPWYPMVAAKPAKAYLFHEACWTLLSQQFDRDIDLDKLFEVCKDVPPVGGEFFDEQSKEWRGVDHAFASRSCPLNQPVSELKGLQKDANRYMPPSPSKSKKRKRSSRLKSDPFEVLTTDIRTQIAACLSTSEYLSLRELSRSMAEVFRCQEFWRSRFLPCGDRGFLYCMLHETKGDGGGTLKDHNESKDWRLVYRCTSNLDWGSTPFLWQKRRQWRNNQWLKERCMMIKASEDVVNSHSSLIDELSWQTISTGIRCDRNIRQGKHKKQCARCWMEHIPFVQAVPLGDSVNSLAISILREGDKTFIAGVDLMVGSGESNLTLGYRIPGTTQAIVSVGEKRLRSFNIIHGEAGIHAMRAIFDDSTYSNWAGQEDGSLQTKKLLLDQDIQAFSAKFDYCKMIEFSIS